MKFSIRRVLFISVFLLLFSVTAVYAVDLLLKLPYKKGESFLVTQGYNTSFTHKGKDKYALDFTQSGCKAYGKPTLATAPGKVKWALPESKTGGYGNAVKIYHGDNLETIYAHLKNFIVKTGQEIQRGQVVGYIGDTGFVSGTACKKYPGTHLHFALYKKQGSQYIGVKPEPMSGYTNFRAGKWYLSDNKIVSGEVKGAKTKKEVWNQKFVSYKLTRINSKVYKVILNFKNTGNTTWVKNKVSLNVIGGYGGVAAKFYHSSWLTKLRPTLLSQNTAPNKIGAFIFYVQLPKTPGKYYPRFRPVRSLSGGGFEWIGKDVGTFPIEIKPIPKPTCSISANPTSILKGEFSLLKWSSSNATSVSITNIGSVSLSGSKKVYPVVNTTYKMTAKGKGGTTTCSVKVKVNVPPSPPPPSPIPPPSPPPPPPPSVSDATPPEVSFLPLTSPQDRLSFKVRWQGEDNESGILNYDFGLWDEEDHLCSLLFEKTIDTEYIFKGEDGKTYIFCLRATDKSGNQSEWVLSEPIDIIVEVWYVPDDFSTIQEAVDAAGEGDTIIVRDGIYQERIEINKSLILRSENGPEKTTILAELFPISHPPFGYRYIFWVKESNITIDGFTIKGANHSTWDSGIFIYSDKPSVKIENCNISNNVFLNNGNGIWQVGNFQSSTISDDIFSDNIRGFYFQNIKESVIKDNILEFSPGTLVGPSNVISDNNFNLSFLEIDGLSNVIKSCNFIKGGILIGGYLISGSPSSFNLKIENSFVNDKPIYLIEQDNRIVSPDNIGNIGQIIVLNSSNVTVEGFNISDAERAIQLINSQDSIIRHNIVKNNSSGIYLRQSSRNKVENNQVLNNKDGISLDYNCPNNEIENNYIADNSGNGIYLYQYSNDNTVRNNNLEFNSGFAIKIWTSSKNNISKNNFSDNFILFDFYYSNGNYIYLNNFVNNQNSLQIVFSVNTWNSPEMIDYSYGSSSFRSYLGNYWNNYKGEDLDEDGIIDTPYLIDTKEDISDKFPLIEPFQNYPIIIKLAEKYFTENSSRKGYFLCQ